jgi:hypothetical protein
MAPGRNVDLSNSGSSLFPNRSKWRRFKLRLALNTPLCLFALRHLRRELKLLGMSRMTNRVLAGLLASLLLLVGTISVSASLHQSLHNDNSANSHLCLFCSFVKGEIDVAGVPSSAAVPGALHLCGVLLANQSSFPIIDYRLAPSRAPPSSIPSITVVG